jgi:hypothetical protein
MRFAMSILEALRDFAEGMTRGFGLFFTERREITAETLSRRPQTPPK